METAMRPSSLVVSLLACAVLVVASESQAARVTVTTCGQVVVGSADLAGDLDCSTYPGHALVLDGSLRLNGFTLMANATDPAGYSAVDCTGKCRVRIKGPGKIVGGSTAVSGNQVRLSKGIEVRDAAEWGVAGAEVKASSVYVHDNGLGLAVGPEGGGGIVGGKVNVKRATVDANGSFGINANVRAVLNFVLSSGNPIADIRSYEKPIVAKSTCAKSAKGNLAETWGVCLNYD
jgi:hypothetical protein